MKEGKILYFSMEEFMVLLELADGSECSLLSDGTVPEDKAFTTAFTALFQRELIQRSGGRFALSGAGKVFDEMRNAPWAVYLSGQSGNTALCYSSGDSICLVEIVDMILSAQYRVRELDLAGLKQWMFDSGLLEPPALTEEDLQALEPFLAEEPPPPAFQPFLRLEKHVNGGPIIETYEVYKSARYWRIHQGNGDKDAYCTKEALSSMLADCFGKESYDYC